MWRVEVLESVSSTQDVVRLRALAGEPEGLVIRADRQEAGRGRHRRVWHSPEGNLYASVLLRPDSSLTRSGHLAFVAAVALFESSSRFLSPERTPGLKWPNDLLIDEKKCAGLLIEAEQDFAVLGVGVNVACAPEEGSFLGGSTDAASLLEAFLEDLESLLSLYALEGFERIRGLWLQRAIGIGEPLLVKNPAGQISGVFEALGSDGALILRMPDGNTVSVSAGDIVLLRDRP